MGRAHESRVYKIHATKRIYEAEKTDNLGTGAWSAMVGCTTIVLTGCVPSLGVGNDWASHRAALLAVGDSRDVDDTVAGPSPCHPAWTTGISFVCAARPFRSSFSSPSLSRCAHQQNDM